MQQFIFLTDSAVRNLRNPRTVDRSTEPDDAGRTNVDERMWRFKSKLLVKQKESQRKKRIELTPKSQQCQQHSQPH